MNLEKAKKLIRKEEGLRLFPYKDTLGKLTIGIGRCIGEIGISEDEAEYLLKNDINRVVESLDKNIPWWIYLTENRQSVIISMCFQLGINGLLKFQKFLSHLKNSNYADAAAEGLNSLWAKQTPKRAQNHMEIIKNG